MSTRRAFFLASAGGVVLAACHTDPASKPTVVPVTSAPPAEDEEVGAVEDLMREHGAIRRVLVVYRESALRLRAQPATVPPDALHKAAELLRSFAEDYHEKLLEEAHVFPAVKGAGGPAAAEIDTLLAQHRRGRQITDWILSATRTSIGAGSAEPLARALDGFARMYEEHAAREDTIVFPAWKKALPGKRMKELGEQFEAIEKKTFGKDGFDDALEKVAAIERAIGLDPAAFMPPAP